MSLTLHVACTGLFASAGLPYPPFRAARQVALQPPKRRRPKRKAAQKSRKKTVDISGGQKIIKKKYFMQKLLPALAETDPRDVLKRLRLTPFDEPAYQSKSKKGLVFLNNGTETPESILAFVRRQGFASLSVLETLADDLHSAEIRREAEDKAAKEKERLAKLRETQPLVETPEVTQRWDSVPKERSIDGHQFNSAVQQSSTPMLVDCVDRTAGVLMSQVWPLLAPKVAVAHVTALAAQHRGDGSRPTALAAAALSNVMKQTRKESLDGRVIFPASSQNIPTDRRQENKLSLIGGARYLALETFYALHEVRLRDCRNHASST